MTTFSPSQPAIPAGWYRDPLGIPQYRWWDGFNWTNSIREDAPAVEADLSAFGRIPARGRHASVA